VRVADLLKFTGHSVLAHRMRALLTALGIAVGVAAVVLLTSIGEGVRRFVLAEFTQFGTNIISVTPGTAQTMGGSIGVFGTVRPLTIDDAEALRRVPYATASVPVVQGNAEVEGNGRKRRVTVYGTGHEFADAFRFEVASGSYLPPDDPRAPRSFAVLGSKMAREIFGDANALGASVRVGSERYRVIGVMKPKGTMIGFDLDDTVYIPAGRALELFDRESLFEVDVLYEESAPVAEVVEGIRRLMLDRHGDEDITITTQQQMLDTLGSVLGVLSFAVAALGSISLLVGAVGIFTIMTIAVRERTSEVGLLRALGAERDQVLACFLIEAVALSLLGGLAGLAFGAGVAWVVGETVRQLPVSFSPLYMGLALGLSVVIGLVAGILPAHNAARLDPVEALRAE
jgi:putative ABC transport system permease protein